MANIKRVRTEREADIVVVAALTGWRGEQRLKPTTVHRFYRVDEDTFYDIANGGYWLNKLADRAAAKFIEAGRAKGQDWSVSEAWSRAAGEGE